MKIYHCDDPKDNPVPLWMVESKPSVQAQKETAEPIPQNLFFPRLLPALEKEKLI